MFANRIRYFNKYVFNRVMLKFAGSSRSQFAVVRHVGRRSGKTYETPIIVLAQGDAFVIALTYGPKVDWYRNLVAAEHGTLLWQKKTYEIGKPESLDQAVALPLFPAFERFILQRSGVQDFVRVKSSVSLPTSA